MIISNLKLAIEFAFNSSQKKLSWFKLVSWFIIIIHGVPNAHFWNGINVCARKLYEERSL